jgi:hypothetical protein
MTIRRRRITRLWVEELERRLAPAAIFSTSSNWSGYAVQAGRHTVTFVSASWVVPVASSDARGYSSTWVGIDGYTSSTVEQIGTESDFVGGQAQYYAWYEMYPKGTVTIPRALQPGDAVAASVSFAHGAFTLSMTSTSWSRPFSRTITARAARSSAEWVVEAPSGSHVLPLADFGTQTFTSAKATVSGITGAIDASFSNSQLNAMNMVSNSGVVQDTTSPLTAAGTAFTVTFQNSGGTHRSGSGSHGTNDAVVIVILGPATTANFTPVLLPVSPIAQTSPPPGALPVQSATGSPAFSFPVLLDPYALPAPAPGEMGPVQDNNIVPARGRDEQPAAPTPARPINPEAPMPPAVPGNLEAAATSVAAPAGFVEGDGPAAALQDGATPNDTAEYGGTTAEVAGVLLALALGGSCGYGVQDPAKRRQHPQR